MSIQWSRVVILSGPSGVGKDTILDAWIEANPAVARVITCTTRKPRPGEVHGVHYFFLTVEEFLDKAEHAGFVEHKWVHGNHYGSPVSEVERLLQAGKFPVMKIDVQGALDVMEAHPELLSIFLLPPSFEELERRLHGRGTEEAAVFAERILAAKRELAEAHRYAHQVVNADVSQTVAELNELLEVACR